MMTNGQDIATCHRAFGEGYQNNEDMRVYEFDTCIAEYAGQSMEIGLREPVMHITNGKPSHVFIFGSRDARKS